MYVWETISYGKKNLRQNKNHRGNKKKLKGRTSKRRGRRKNDVERSGGKASPATAPSPQSAVRKFECSRTDVFTPGRYSSGK